MKTSSTQLEYEFIYMVALSHWDVFEVVADIARLGWEDASALYAEKLYWVRCDATLDEAHMALRRIEDEVARGLWNEKE